QVLTCSSPCRHRFRITNAAAATSWLGPIFRADDPATMIDDLIASAYPRRNADDMEALTLEPWAPVDYCLRAPPDPADSHISELAAAVHARACRTNFEMPGFCLVDLGPDATSSSLRQAMIGLKRELQRLHRANAACDLV